MDKDILSKGSDYWNIADVIKSVYTNEGSLATLLDFERVLDEMDLYAFKNWQLGELVEGPDIKKYTVSCIFMWPDRLMPDPRGGRRLLSYDCEVLYKKTDLKIPVKIETRADYRPGTKKARLVEKTVWLVEITMPKALMNDIRQGSIELEGESIDFDDLDTAYEEDLDNEQYQDNAGNDEENQAPEQQAQVPQAPQGAI
jgi:hypothetical protein